MKRTTKWSLVTLAIIFVLSFSWMHYKASGEMIELRGRLDALQKTIPRIVAGAFRPGDIITKGTGSDWKAIIVESDEIGVCFNLPGPQGNRECEPSSWMVSDDYFTLVTPGDKNYEKLRRQFPTFP